tara:strand:- start:3432 stop:4367 length:936 start_codon:yes stop_codon:yes gene_type:complete
MVSIIGFKGSIKSLKSLNKGLTRHGDSLEIVESLDDERVSKADGYIQTNLLKPKFYQNNRHLAYQYIQDSNKPYLVNESPAFRKFPLYSRLGWFSYKWNDGEFGNENSPPDRWNKFVEDTNIKIKDWNSPGDHILIMGQKEGDSSLINLYEKYDSFYEWVTDIIFEIRKYSDRKIIVRPHPRNLRHGQTMANRLNKKKKLNVIVSDNVDSGGIQGGDGLDQDFQKAYCVITYNSLSAVESICEGIPTFAFDGGSMIYPIAHKDLSKLENLDYNIDIQQWCNDVAYTQWTSTENRKGRSWAHLKPLVFGDKK